MAFRPSFRRHVELESTELNLTPIMNLMVVLIPLLLSSAQFIKIGIIELNLPPSAGAASSMAEKPKEKERTLDLTVSITNRGFYVSNALVGVQNLKDNGPTIPLDANGQYDFQELSRQMYEIKKKVGDKFPDSDIIVIQAEGNISYQILVSTMDATRSITLEEHKIALFPHVSLSAGIF